VLVWRPEQIAEALAGLYTQKLVDGLTLPEIIKHNEGILRLARDGVDISGHKVYTLYYVLTMRQFYEVGFRVTGTRSPARSCECVNCIVYL